MALALGEICPGEVSACQSRDPASPPISSLPELISKTSNPSPQVCTATACHCNWQYITPSPIMALRVSNNRALSSALRTSRAALIRNAPIVRTFSASQHPHVVVSQDTPNMRHAQRGPDETLRRPVVNPTDKYAAKADDLHRYGAWLMGCLPKYVQQFSVWKDELVIYISPAGVIPVFTFLKCMSAPN